MRDLWKGFWIRETGTGQQVAQLHERYDDDDDDDDDDNKQNRFNSKVRISPFTTIARQSFSVANVKY